MIGAQLQQAIFNALRTAPALAGGRVYDDVPSENKRVADTGAAFPYITIGDEQVIDDGNTCEDGWEVFSDVHVWSRAVGYPEAKDLAAAVYQRLRAITAVTGFAVIAVSIESQRALRDPDGKTSHVVGTYRFLLDPA